jgi:hypothetical protein
MAVLLKFFIISFVTCFIGCTMDPDIKDNSTVITNAGIKGAHVSMTFTKGNAWGTVVKMGAVNLRIRPQIAVWIEDSNAQLVQNLFVTHCFAKQDWKFLKSHPDSTCRTMCFPYWINTMVHAAQPLPTKRTPLPDAVTSATPAGSFILETQIDSSITHGIIWCEINSSFDNNETYAKDRPESFNGQPSLLFSGEFNTADTSHTVVMTYRGHGGESGGDGQLYKDDSGITTAKQIITKIEFKIR